MKIVVPGGTGQVGGILTRAFVRDGHDVVVLSRSSSAAAGRTVQWDGRTLEEWTDELALLPGLGHQPGFFAKRVLICAPYASQRIYIRATG